MIWVKLAVLSDSEPLWWEKIGKFVNQAKLAILSDSKPLWWEKIGKVVNWVKLAILSDSEPLAVLEGKIFEKEKGCFYPLYSHLNMGM